MIEWITVWIKQIILLVLIATFIDLLLPTNAMDRYVKLVMGLIIIMAILSPILQLIDQDIDLSILALSGTPKEIKNMGSLEQIKQRSQDLKKSQETFFREQIANSIEKKMESQIIEKFPIEVISMHVEMSTGIQKEEKIKHVHIVAQARAPNPSSERGVTPVTPVVISKDSPLLLEKKSEGKQAEIKKKVSDFLVKMWHLLPEQINVRVDSM